MVTACMMTAPIGPFLLCAIIALEHCFRKPQGGIPFLKTQPMGLVSGAQNRYNRGKGGNRMERLAAVRQQIDSLLEKKESVIVAIDGKCTSGKTTLAAQLAEYYDCNVFHMDDFFLRPEQRTPQRYAEVGGNVDYERFLAEVLIPLRQGNSFSYRPFACKTFTFSSPVSVLPKALTVVEGSYSLHPYFADPYDLRILLTVDPEVQHTRVLERPAFVQERFFTQWIPMENAYLEHFQIADKADIIL